MSLKIKKTAVTKATLIRTHVLGKGESLAAKTAALNNIGKKIINLELNVMF